MHKLVSMVLLAAFLVVSSRNCIADLYEYTDASGVVHFTDDALKVPPKIRERSKRESESSLTPKELNTLKGLMAIEHNQDHDIPVKNIQELKKGLNAFAEYSKSELGDPGEPRDARLSTPEGAWNLFKSGLRNGNLADIKTAVIGRFWKESKGFKGITKSQLKQLSQIVPDNAKVVTTMKNEHFAVIEFVVNDKGKENLVGEMEFINFYGNWKLQKF